MIQVGENCVFNLPDMQQSTEGFAKIPIKKVGMRNVELPLTIYQKEEERFIDVKATFSSYCDLVEDVKGINMSRITRTLIEVSRDLDTDVDKSNGFDIMERFSKELKEAHGSDNIYVKMAFSYPYWEKTYATKLDSPEFVDVIFETILTGDVSKHYMTVKSVGMSLCPCSKEMSMLINNISKEEQAELDNLSGSLKEKVENAGFGAHNQRSHLDITVELKDGEIVWIEDLVKLADKSFSSPTKAVLKRPDEKIETEMPYLGGYYAETTEGNFDFVKVEGTGAKFVEDISRDASEQLNKLLDKTILDYVIVCNNDESIHSRDILATAVLSAGRSLS